jgi:light-regulated signal transduction histidine kinase (bacteriophytochrome)
MVRDIPLIILTALDDGAAMIDGLSTGADDYIQKSTEFEVLRARMRAQMRRKQFEDDNRRIREELLRKQIETLEARSARQIAEERAAMVEELERKNKELEAFSYSVSHDLRAPLRAVFAFSTILRDEFSSQMPAEANGLLNRVLTNAQRMERLVDDLLRLSTLERQPLSKELVNAVYP